MKALSILGSGSGAGKSWITTALGAWLHGQGLRVAPFKAQNMSNNAWVTLEGGEIGRAQAVQAEACGLIPTVETLRNSLEGALELATVTIESVLLIRERYEVGVL